MTQKVAMRSNAMEPETFLKLYRDIRDATRLKEEAAAGLKAARERAKSAGVDLAALKLVEGLSTLDDADAELRVRETLRYASWLGLEIGTQMDLFDGDAEPKLTDKVFGEHAEWKAEQAGYAAGKAGEPRDNCPHALASPLAQRWHVGWLDGQAANAPKLAEREERNEEAASTRRKRRKDGDDAPEPMH